MVEIVEFAYGASWILRRRSWRRNGDEAELYLTKSIEMIYLP